MTALTSVLEGNAFLLLAVFARVGSAIMLLPGIGEINVPARIRLLLALAVTIVLLPIVGGDYPPRPDGLGPFLGLIIGEILIGLIFGALARLFLMALQVAGSVIATQGGLAYAQSFDPSIGTQGALVSSFLTILALVLLFQADLHHLMLGAIGETYNVFPPGAGLPWGDLAEHAIQLFTVVFNIGIRVAAPVLVFGLVFYAAAGVISKLLPQVQIFFIAMPINIVVSFALVMLTLSTMMMVFLGAFEAWLVNPFGGE